MQNSTTRFTSWFCHDPLVARFSTAAGLVVVYVALASPLLVGDERGNSTATDEVHQVADSIRETLTLKGHTDLVPCQVLILG
jgi:hypothetical protein